MGERWYFRGKAFNMYKGRSRENGLACRYLLRGTEEGGFVIRTSRTLPATAGVLQEVLLEPLDTPVLFGVSSPHWVRGQFQVVLGDAMGTLLLPYAPSSRIRYMVRSVPDRLAEEDARQGSGDYSNVMGRQFVEP